MQKANPDSGNWRNVVFFATALLVIAADQLSKIWIRSYAEGQSIFEAGFFRITHIHNTGGVFGLFQDQSFFLAIVAFIGITFILLFAFLFYRYFPYLDSRFGKPALGLILGGTVGNLIDRLRLGYVTDFIDISIWPSFNVADSAITVGTIILAYSLLFLSRTKKTDLSA